MDWRPGGAQWRRPWPASRDPPDRDRRGPGRRRAPGANRRAEFSLAVFWNAGCASQRALEDAQGRAGSFVGGIGVEFSRLAATPIVTGLRAARKFLALLLVRARKTRRLRRLARRSRCVIILDQRTKTRVCT